LPTEVTYFNSTSTHKKTNQEKPREQKKRKMPSEDSEKAAKKSKKDDPISQTTIVQNYPQLSDVSSSAAVEICDSFESMNSEIDSDLEKFLTFKPRDEIEQVWKKTKGFLLHDSKKKHKDAVKRIKKFKERSDVNSFLKGLES